MIQLAVWAVTVTQILKAIANNSPSWGDALDTGTGIQFSLLIITTLLKKKFERGWLTIDLLLVAIMIWSALDTKADYSIGYMVFIVAPIVLFILSLIYILKDLADSFKSRVSMQGIADDKEIS